MKELHEKSRIRELRNDFAISQVEMADELGVSQQAISRIENYPDNIPVDLRKSISKKYNVSIDYLLGLSNKKTISNTTNPPVNIERTEISIGYIELSQPNKLMINALIRALILQQEMSGKD